MFRIVLRSAHLPSSRWRVSRLAGALCLSLFALASPAAAQATVKGSYGDWELRCEAQPAAVAPEQAQPTPTGEQCYLYQNIADESSDRLNLIISFVRVQDPKNADKTKLILRVLAPLGVLLPRGLGLKLDETDIGSTGFVRCWSNACVAEVDVDKSLQEQFTAAKTAIFFFAITEDEVRGLPVSLDKLGDGLAQLQ